MKIIFSFFCKKMLVTFTCHTLICAGGEQSSDLPLSQPPQPTPPPSATNTLRPSSCPSTPELQRRREEAVKRLAAKVLAQTTHKS